MARRRSKSVRSGRGENCLGCGTTMDRFQHEKGWKPRPGQPFYFQYWDRCGGCGRLQHYDAAKVELVQPAQMNRAPAPPAGSPLAQARLRANRAVNALNGRKGRRAFIGALLGIEERFASVSEMDEVECESIVERCAGIKKGRPSGGRP